MKIGLLRNVIIPFDIAMILISSRRGTTLGLQISFFGLIVSEVDCLI